MDSLSTQGMTSQREYPNRDSFAALKEKAKTNNKRQFK